MIALFGKRPSPYYGKNSSNKQRDTTVHHYFTTSSSFNMEHFENFEFSKVSSSAITKTFKRYDETGSHEDRHRTEDPEFPLLQRITSFEIPTSE